MINLPMIDDNLTDSQIKLLSTQIKDLAKSTNTVILAHNYQLPEVQDVADFVGDSLQLARQAAKTDAQNILFCGVHFMAETAKILSPEKTVMLPDAGAGCSLADSITEQQLVEWKSKFDNPVVIMYVNTSAAVKAHTDYCCTSSNAVSLCQEVAKNHPGQPILFGPDMWLGAFVEKTLKNNGIKLDMHVWDGECHVHAGIKPSDIQTMFKENPEADFLVHPECGCSTQVMEYVASGDLDKDKVQMLSTGQMLDHVKGSDKDFIIATETGMLYPLAANAPKATLVAANDKAVCKYMKMITLPKMLKALQTPSDYEVDVDSQTAELALIPITRMVSIG